MRKFNITVNGSAYEVEVEEVGGVASTVATTISAPIATPIANPVAAPVAPKAVPKVAGNGAPVKSPMPGTITRLTFTNGQKVKKGEAICGLEAMKMENDILASQDGVITYAINKGATVNTGDVIATIA